MHPSFLSGPPFFVGPIPASFRVLYSRLPLLALHYTFLCTIAPSCVLFSSPSHVIALPPCMPLPSLSTVVAPICSCSHPDTLVYALFPLLHPSLHAVALPAHHCCPCLQPLMPQQSSLLPIFPTAPFLLLLLFICPVTPIHSFLCLASPTIPFPLPS